MDSPFSNYSMATSERVTPWNAVINGSECHPGATMCIFELPASRKMRIAMSKKLPSSRGEYGGKIVHRCLQDGDVVLVNGQPTLKPSIMAHGVRLLVGERTLRMHYANLSYCNTKT